MVIRDIFNSIRFKATKNKAIYALAMMALFWTIFEGIVSYIAPIIIVEHGISKTLMGIILGSSSVAGACFDFIICKFIKNTNYRRIFLLMFVICLVFLFILWQAHVFIIYLLAMILWGIFYDLNFIGNFNFIGRCTEKNEHASSFGVLNIFQAAGYMLAPLIAGLVVVETVDNKPFFLALIFLILSFVFYLVLVSLKKKDRDPICQVVSSKPGDVFFEFKLWHKVGKIILPVLILTVLLNILDSFFWTIGPIFAQGFNFLDRFDGLFLTAYALPAVIIGWFIGGITKKIGKKSTAFASFLLGSIILTMVSLTSNPYIILSIIFLSSCFFAAAWPSINGAYADYISETPVAEHEIEGIGALSSNIGYIIGPMVAGIIADMVGNAQAFSILGVFNVAIAFILIFITPKKINIPQNIVKDVAKV